MLLLSSSCLFIDIRIGFQKASYTFREPATFPETVILDLHKENEQLSERTLFVSVAVSDATSNPEIQSATISSKTMDNDYSLLGEVRRITQAFQPHTQTLQVYFDLFKDDIAEGTEAFQITALPDPDYLQAGFMSPINLFASTSIVILDANRELCMALSIIIISFTYNLVPSLPAYLKLRRGKFVSIYRKQTFLSLLFLNMGKGVQKIV